MPMFLSLIASGVVAATPVTPAPWFTFDDYPMKAFERKQEGISRFELLIAPDGKIASCTITKSSGSEELDKTTCWLATKRARFLPARGADGQPVYGVYRSQAIWLFPNRTIPAEPGPDLEIGLNKLPEGAHEPAAVKLAYQVDAQGTPSACTLMPSSTNQPSILVELGCKQLLEQVPHTPVVGPNGQAVAAVKTGAVLFKPASGS